MPLGKPTAGLLGRTPGKEGYISRIYFGAGGNAVCSCSPVSARTRARNLNPMADKVLPGKHSAIETLSGKLKGNKELEPTRHGTINSAFHHILFCLVANMLGQTAIRMEEAPVHPGSWMQLIRPSGPYPAISPVLSGHLLPGSTGNQGVNWGSIIQDLGNLVERSSFLTCSPRSFAMRSTPSRLGCSWSSCKYS